MTKTARTSRRSDAAPSLAAQLEGTRLYSEELGIDLGERADDTYFRWFLASILFGGHISEAIARNTYHAFERHGLTTPRKIVDAGWDFLVTPIMREGGYVRYDGRKSDQVLRDCRKLLDDYGGRLSKLEAQAHTNAELEQRIDEFYGVGPVTANIFLRELRPFWPAANPEPLPEVTETAHRFGIDLSGYDRKSLVFARVEAGLMRLRHKAPSDMESSVAHAAGGDRR